MRELGIYYEPDLAPKMEVIGDKIGGLFPFLKITILGVWKVPLSAWDSFLNQYDAPAILSRLDPKEAMALLWFISGDLGDTEHKGLFGVALGQRAVVSSFRVDDPEGLAKAAGHELGHILGLGHCSGDCIMHPSRTLAEAASKSNTFCPVCGEKIRRVETKSFDA